MAPFRPSNLNKRAYPGNASVVGGTVAASCSPNTTVCCSTFNLCSACACIPGSLVLGCRGIQNCCGCPCCDVCCKCNCTVCTRTTPGGMWKTSEVYTAREADTWGPPTSSNDAKVCICCFNEGTTCVQNATCDDCKAFVTCITGSPGSGTAYAVVPIDRQYSDGFGGGAPDNGGSTNNNWDTVCCACVHCGNCGWYVPGCALMKTIGYNCRSYWDAYCSSDYWTASGGNYAYVASFSNGCFCTRRQRTFIHSPVQRCTRAFRCISF